MKEEPLIFNDLKDALKVMDSKLRLGLESFMNRSSLLKDLGASRQTTLDSFFS